jgi:hypothetical protein
MAYSVYRIPGLDYSQNRRDVVFLESDEDTRMNAKRAFEKLNFKNGWEMLNKFDLWKRGEQHHNKYFHGFDGPNRYCFVFKRKQAGTYYRYYGFLIHPRPATDPRYELCALISHVQKNQEDTDPSQLSLVNSIGLTREVIVAVKKEFPELTTSTTRRS